MALKNGLLDLDRNGSDDAGAHVAWFELLFKEIAALLDNGLAESGHVRATLGGVLAIDEGVEFFAITCAVGEGHLDVGAVDMNDWIEWWLGELGGD